MIAVPDWLTTRGGTIKPGPGAARWLVLLGGRPEYSLAPVPVDGRVSCAILQTNNGKRLDATPLLFATEVEAIRGGLEQLRVALGW